MTAFDAAVAFDSLLVGFDGAAPPVGSSAPVGLLESDGVRGGYLVQTQWPSPPPLVEDARRVLTSEGGAGIVLAADGTATILPVPASLSDAGCAAMASRADGLAIGALAPALLRAVAVEVRCDLMAWTDGGVADSRKRRRAADDLILAGIDPWIAEEL